MTKLITIVSRIVIVIGMIYLAQDKEASALSFGECFFTYEHGCESCQQICSCDPAFCREYCMDGGPHHGEMGGTYNNPKPCP